ncbi:hypothetical protein MP638_007190, partial [Amoeboaphelidium occidentale]
MASSSSTTAPDQQVMSPEAI